MAQLIAMEKRIAVLQAIVEKVLDVLPNGTPAPRAPGGPEAPAVTARPATGARGDSGDSGESTEPSIRERLTGGLDRARDVVFGVRAADKRSLEL